MSVTVLSDKTVRARKPHKCSTCGAVAVEPGQEYRRETLIYDGRIYDWVMCGPCDELFMEVYDYAYCSDEGVSSHEFLNWAEEHPEDQRAKDYLARRTI